MSNIFITGDALYFTAPSKTSTNYQQTSSSGYSYTGFYIEWQGVNLGYTPGYIAPTSGTLTYISVQKLDGTNLYAASDFTLNLATLPQLWAPDVVIFQNIASRQVNNIIGSNGNDTLVGLHPDDNINGGLGVDTLLVGSASSDFSITEVSSTYASGKITYLGNGNAFTFFSVEKIAFTDKTVNVSDYAAPQISNDVYNLSVIVSPGILSANAVYLKNLTETFTYNGNALVGHTIQYGSSTFNYADVDALLTTVTRNAEFTNEFQSEIAALAPSAANLSYGDAVKIIGQSNIDAALLNVAGSDGNYVG